MFVIVEAAVSVVTTDQKSEDGATRAKGKGEEKSSCELPAARGASCQRASMGKARLSHLVLLHIHYNTPIMPIDLDKVVDIYRGVGAFTRVIRFIVKLLIFISFCASNARFTVCLRV